MKNLLKLLCAIVLFAACKKNNPAPNPGNGGGGGSGGTTPPTSTYVPDNSFKVIAYMPSYRDPATIDDKKYKMITHLFYAFISPNTSEDGSLQSLPQPGRFGTLKNKAKLNNVKFGISVGPGTGVTESTFLNICKSTTSRAAFVRNIVNFAKLNDCDGVDIDWEYPRDNNGGSEAFHSLMVELSTELHKLNKFLSAAITPAVYVSSNKAAILPKTYDYVDFFNIMQYDGAGYDSAEPLNHAAYKMSTASLDYWLGTRAMPKVKAMVGVPLYGKSSGGSSIAYRDIETSGADVNLNVATVNGVQYGYNGIVTMKQKAQLAKDRANGIMFWEFGQDSNSDKSLIKAANDQLGRSY